VTDQPALETPSRRPDGLPTRTKPSTKAPTKAPAKPRARIRATPAAATPAPASTERSSLDLARRIVELAEDKKAADIVLLDLGGLTTVADYFVIASGGSDRQLDAIADGIVAGLRDEKVKPYGREGTAASHWVLVDYGGVIVHVFTPPERDFYQLERHWSEAKTVLRVQ
jgi:ribosome-associated protein